VYWAPAVNTTVRTHYDILGVAPDSPEVVIKAAYRALAKEFHPDRADANATDTNRFIEIQEAYAVLSKPASRSEYDEELREAALFQSPPMVPEAEVGGAPAPPALNGAEHSASDIERICARLALYSDTLAQSFHEAHLRGECGDDPWRFAGEMEKGFFRQYFGEDPDIQALAKMLMLSSRTAAAMALNKLVAADPAAKSGELRDAVAAILEEHFPQDTLFTDWLKVKLGITPPAAAAVHAIAESAAVQPEDTAARDVAAGVERSARAAPPIRKVSRAAATKARTSPGVVPSRRRAPIGPASDIDDDDDFTDLQAESALQLPRPWRSAGLLIFWAVAIYFLLFTALPLLM
jgi:hypothetical protein